MAQYVKYFGFVDDVLLIHNGANGPKSRTMLFRQVRQMAARVRSCCHMRRVTNDDDGRQTSKTTDDDRRRQTPASKTILAH